MILWQWVTTKGQGQCYRYNFIKMLFKQQMREFAVLWSCRSSVSGLQD